MIITSNLNKRAWEVRRKAAKKWNCPVLEISWKVCIRIAKEEKKMKRSGRRVDHLRGLCVKEIKRVISYFSNKTGKEIPVPKVDFKKRGKTAGTCYTDRISLNWKLLKQERENYIKQTPGHEAVHFVEHYLYGKSNHKERWKVMMMEVGLKPERCHNYDTKNIGIKKPYIYYCDCGITHHLSQLQHQRAQNRTVYWCNKCKTELIWEGE